MEAPAGCHSDWLKHCLDYLASLPSRLSPQLGGGGLGRDRGISCYLLLRRRVHASYLALSPLAPRPSHAHPATRTSILFNGSFRRHTKYIDRSIHVQESPSYLTSDCILETHHIVNATVRPGCPAGWLCYVYMVPKFGTPAKSLINTLYGIGDTPYSL